MERIWSQQRLHTKSWKFNDIDKRRMRWRSQVQLGEMRSDSSGLEIAKVESFAMPWP